MYFYYRAYCLLHFIAKRLLGRIRSTEYTFIRVPDIQRSAHQKVLLEKGYVNDKELKQESLVDISELFPQENSVPKFSNKHLQYIQIKDSGPFIFLSSDSDRRSSAELWLQFLERSQIPTPYRYSELRYGGYMLDVKDGWCLPSWIWTNAALVRSYASLGLNDQAVKIGECLLKLQRPDGSWVVRNDYSRNGAHPIIAPNDSAYIAENCMLVIYGLTGDSRFLDSAVRCADWIVASAREDGLVSTGYDLKSGVWIANHVIVDTGFTLGVFARLYDLTGKSEYLDFSRKFVASFIYKFFDFKSSGFATSIDRFDRKVGGRFARGQAWALEGLMQANKILNSEKVGAVIESTVSLLLDRQLENGAWPYNFDRPLMGEDCKGTPVIAKVLTDYFESSRDARHLDSADRALKWCRKNTLARGPGAGGIYCFSAEGAIVHSPYRAVAMVYSSAYALEAQRAVDGYERDNIL